MNTISAGFLHPGNRLKWRDVPHIYKKRLQHLWYVLKLNFVAAVILLVVAALLPLALGLAFFFAHRVLSTAAVLLVAIICARFYWLSLKAAFTNK